MGKLSSLRDGIEKASKALDMSYQERMQRAKDMGFDTDATYYHGTRRDFDEFEASNPRGAIGNKKGVYFTKDKRTAEEYSLGNGEEYMDDKSRIMEVYLKNPEAIDTYGGPEYFIEDPSHIRSVNAAFDPAKKDSANLLASMGGAAVLGGAALAPEDAEAGVFGKIIKAGVNTSKKAADEYSAGHTAPYRDADGYHPQLDNVEPMYGEDIYGRQAKNLYGYEDGSNESIDIIQRMRGKPDAEVDIYRAVPAGVNEFNQRDWVTLSKRYAREHGDSNIEGRYDILKGKAKASDLFNEGYPAEWGIDVLDVAKKYGISTVLAGSVLAGTMTPEQAQAATGLENFTQRRAAKRDYWKQLKSTMLEGMAGVNRGLIDTLNFVGPDQVNAVLQLSGSENRIPTFSDIPGVQQATQGGYMEPGTARDVVRTGSEFLSPL